MFGNKKSDMTSTSVGTSAVGINSNNSIVGGTRIEGKIVASSDLRIDGELKGTLECSGKVIIGPEGRVVGDITCQNAVIEGTFEGKLICNDLLNVRESAVITGEIITDKLTVQSGATYNVNCQMGRVQNSQKTSSSAPVLNGTKSLKEIVMEK